MSNIKSIGQGLRGLRLPQIGGFPLILSLLQQCYALTYVLHCDANAGQCVTYVLHKVKCIIAVIADRPSALQYN